jgi:sugar lactone lactonase YvrE
MMKRLIVTAVLWLAVAPSAGASTVPITPVVSFNPDALEYPEGLTIDHRGTIFVGMFFSTAIRQIASDGTQSTAAVIEPSGQSVLLGLAVDHRRTIYAAVASDNDAFNGIWRVMEGGEATLYAQTDPAGAPNGLAFDKRGNLYVADSLLGVVWRIPRGGGTAERWVDDAALKPDPSKFGFGANGVAVRRHAVYVSNTDQALIARIPIKPNGHAGAVSVFAADAALANADGIAFDLRGNLYVACSVTSNRLVRISRNGNRVTVLATAEDGLDYPASVAFGTGRGERKDLYITNVGVNFNNPGVVKARIGVPGQPLP